MRSVAHTFLVAVLALSVGVPALAVQEDVAAGKPPFKPGDVITYKKIDELKNYLPPQFWDNRDFFFYPGMQMKIGPFFRNYSEPKAYLAATKRFAGQAKLGPQSSLTNYTAGRPFPTAKIDCKNDPLAGEKIIWDFDYQWMGDGWNDHFYYSYWDRGEELPLYYAGTSKEIMLSHRVEPQYLDTRDGDLLFRGERRKFAWGVDVDEPFDARGISLLTYRYKASDLPKSKTKNDDTWVYVPTLRRVRRISSAQRTDAVSGTDFTFDDLRSFSGIVPQYKWSCLGEMDVLAPVNTIREGYPYKKNSDFGPYGLSYASDRWELRHAWEIRFIPRNPDHPYSHKDIYVDKQTYVPLYSFAYDRKGDLWKIIWHDHRWSDSELPGDHGKKWYKGWKGIPDPRDLRSVSDSIVNVQTGTGDRIEYWDSNGTPYRSLGRVRRYIDIGRLTHGH